MSVADRAAIRMIARRHARTQRALRLACPHPGHRLPIAWRDGMRPSIDHCDERASDGERAVSAATYHPYWGAAFRRRGLICAALRMDAPISRRT
jgi:hypothetical protein